MWSYSQVGGGRATSPHYFILYPFYESMCLHHDDGGWEAITELQQCVTCSLSSPLLFPYFFLFFSSSLPLSLFCTESKEYCGLDVKRTQRQENDRGFPCVQKTVWELLFPSQVKSYLKSKSYYEWNIRACPLGCS